MARARTVRPEFFQHEGLAECSPAARLLFIGLWTLADREGRLEDRPKRIGAMLMPYEDADIEALLTELQCGNFIERYDAAEKSVISIPKFAKHQHPHPKEPVSELPERPADTPCKRPFTRNGPHGREKPAARSVSVAHPSADSDDQLSLVVSTGHGTARQDTVGPLPSTAGTSLPSGSSFPSGSSGSSGPSAAADDRGSRVSERSFDDLFWPAYPRKENRKDALRAWKRHVRVDQLPAVMAGLERWKACEQWRRGIIPHGATWLNRGQWNETPMDLADPGRPGTAKQRTDADYKSWGTGGVTDG